MPLEQLGRYRILEHLGSGRFGDVYAVRHPDLAKDLVARLCSIEDQQVRKAFAEEGRRACRLVHPHVVRTYEVAEHEGMPFLVQERLTGATLDRVLRESPPRSAVTSLDLLRQIGRALDHAHGKKTVHRALRPASIHRLADGTIKVRDFGLARLATTESQISEQSVRLEEAGYLAPEQVRGDAVDPRTDVFAFGVVAFELLTGQRPFLGGHLSALVYQILYKVPLSPVAVWPECPPPLSELILRCLEKKPEDRFPTMSALLESLGRIRDEAVGGKWPALLEARAPAEGPESTAAGEVSPRDISETARALGAGEPTLRVSPADLEKARTRSGGASPAPDGSADERAETVRVLPGRPGGEEDPGDSTQPVPSLAVAPTQRLPRAPAAPVPPAPNSDPTGNKAAPSAAAAASSRETVRVPLPPTPTPPAAPDDPVSADDDTAARSGPAPGEPEAPRPPARTGPGGKAAGLPPLPAVPTTRPIPAAGAPAPAAPGPGFETLPGVPPPTPASPARPPTGAGPASEGVLGDAAQKIGDLVARGDLEAARKALDETMMSRTAGGSSSSASPPPPEAARTAPPAVPARTPPAPAAPAAPAAPPAAVAPAEPPTPADPGASTSTSVLPRRAAGLPIGLLVGIAAVVFVGIVLAFFLLRSGSGTETPDLGGSERQEAATPTPSTEATTGTVLLDPRPWARITEITDGTGRVIDLPASTISPARFDLPPGSYRIVLRHPDAEDEAVCEVAVRVGSSTRCTAQLLQPTPNDLFRAAGWWP